MSDQDGESQWYVALFEEDCLQVMELLKKDPRLLKVGWEVDSSREVEGSRLNYWVPKTKSKWFGRTALHVGARRGCKELLEQVIKLCSKMHRQEDEGSSSGVPVSLDDLLLQKDGEYQLDALAMAVVNGNRDVLTILLKESVDCTTVASRYEISKKIEAEEIEREKKKPTEEDAEKEQLRVQLTKVIDKVINQQSSRGACVDGYKEHRDFNFLPRNEYLFHFLFVNFKEIPDDMDRSGLHFSTKKREEEREEIIMSVAVEIMDKVTIEGGLDLWRFLWDLQDGQGRAPIHVAVDEGTVGMRIIKIFQKIDSGSLDLNNKLRMLETCDGGGRTALNRLAMIPCNDASAGKAYGEDVNGLFDFLISEYWRWFSSNFGGKYEEILIRFCKYVGEVSSSALDDLQARVNISLSALSTKNGFKGYQMPEGAGMEWWSPGMYLEQIFGRGIHRGEILGIHRAGAIHSAIMHKNHHMLDSIFLCLDRVATSEWFRDSDGLGEEILAVISEELRKTRGACRALREFQIDLLYSLLVVLYHLFKLLYNLFKGVLYYMMILGIGLPAMTIIAFRPVITYCISCYSSYYSAYFSCPAPTIPDIVSGSDIIYENGRDTVNRILHIPLDCDVSSHHEYESAKSEVKHRYALDCLELAALVGDPKALRVMLKYIIGRQSKPKATYKGKQYRNYKNPFPAFHLASGQGKYETLKLLADNHYSDLFVEDFMGNTPLHYAANGCPIEFNTRLLDYANCQHILNSQQVREREFEERYRRRLLNKSYKKKEDTCIQHNDADLEKESSTNLFCQTCNNTSTQQDDLVVEREGCVNLLVQHGCDIFKTNHQNQAPDPGSNMNIKFLSWWYEKQAKEFASLQGIYTFAANAISVTATLVATASYVGPLQPPMGYDNNLDSLQLSSKWVKIFIICDTMSFYLAITALIGSLIPSLPMPQQSMLNELRRTRRMLTLAVTMLFPSIIFVLVAFASSSIAVTIYVHGGLKITKLTAYIGGSFCFAMILLFFIRLIGSIFYRYRSMRKIYNATSF